MKGTIPGGFGEILSSLKKRFAGAGGRVEEKGKGADKAAIDKIAGQIRQSEILGGLPDSNIAAIIEHMEVVKVSRGDTVIREGEQGDSYYLLVAGDAEVMRRTGATGNDGLVARLKAGSGFGEEALISNARRNATVRMQSDGALARLSRENFNDYIKEFLVTWLSPTESQKKVNAGAVWLDVREEGGARLRGAAVAPLSRLREMQENLDRNVYYVCYCGNGRASATAAFLLAKAGFSVGVLRGGIEGLRRSGLI